MIAINLSEEQAKSLLNSMGWRYGSGEYERLDVKSDVAKEVFIQLEQQLMPRSTSASELAVWRHEQGLNEMDVEKWMRKNESLGSAFSSYIDSVANQVMEK